LLLPWRFWLAALVGGWDGGERMSEHQTQAAFAHWCQMQAKNIPELDLASAIPNGGQRHLLVAVKLKKEGVKAGEPDWQWPVARGGFIGLAIEFKDGSGNPSQAQRERIAARQRAGWCVCVCWDWEAAARTVQGYAGLARVDFGRPTG
jgi:hypothetical protein